MSVKTMEALLEQQLSASSLVEDGDGPSLLSRFAVEFHEFYVGKFTKKTAEIPKILLRNRTDALSEDGFLTRHAVVASAPKGAQCALLKDPGGNKGHKKCARLKNQKLVYLIKLQILDNIVYFSYFVVLYEEVQPHCVRTIQGHRSASFSGSAQVPIPDSRNIYSLWFRVRINH